MKGAVAQGDRLIDRAYRRFGWRIVPLLCLSVWTVGILDVGLALIVFARVLGWTTDELTSLTVWNLLILLGCMTLSVLHGVHACRPLRRFESGELDAEQTWRAVVPLPRSFTRANCLIAALATPFGFVNLARVEPFSIEATGIFVLVMSGISLYGLSTALFVAPVFFRPILRAIAQGIDGNSPPVSGYLLTNRLLFLVPGLGVAMAITGASFGLSPGTDPSTAFTHIAIAVAVSAVATLPITMLVGRAVSVPIEDLLDGTRRLRDGDYTKRVPELSSDELGDLARSFNEAMEGLADRQRLSREKVQLLDQVRASRARIVAASDAGRRRVERNLHDGAQQRLVALALDLSLLEETARSLNTDEVVIGAVVQAANDVKEALGELRELARGLHPSVLSTDGLAYALDQLAARAKLPVTVHSTAERFAPAVESAAYFVAAEALANVAKYAQAERAEVSAQVADGELIVAIADDGIGGATLGSGTGLAGLADRVEALDGHLRIDSPAGRGTKVIAQIPVNGRVPVAMGGESS